MFDDRGSCGVHGSASARRILVNPNQIAATTRSRDRGVDVAAHVRFSGSNREVGRVENRKVLTRVLLGTAAAGRWGRLLRGWRCRGTRRRRYGLWCGLPGVEQRTSDLRANGEREA